MHDIFTDRYFDLEFHVKCDDVQEFIDLINTLDSQPGLDPSIIDSYSGNINDYCCGSMRGCGDVTLVSIGQMIGQYACNYDRTEFLDVLVSKNYDLSETIHYAVSHDAYNIANSILLVNPIYANAPGPRGKTPLYYAISNISVPMVDLLLSHGANPLNTYGMAQTNYIDHAIWVHDHYYSVEDGYDDKKIAIVNMLKRG